MGTGQRTVGSRVSVGTLVVMMGVLVISQAAGIYSSPGERMGGPLTSWQWRHRWSRQNWGLGNFPEPL